MEWRAWAGLGCIYGIVLGLFFAVLGTSIHLWREAAPYLIAITLFLFGSLLMGELKLAMWRILPLIQARRRRKRLMEAEFSERRPGVDPSSLDALLGDDDGLPPKSSAE